MKASQDFRFEDLTILPPEKKLEQTTNTDRRSLGPDQGVENKSCSANRTFWKLPNVIKNQINTYISSLATCPVTGSRRG